MKSRDKRLFPRQAAVQRLSATLQGLTRRDFIGGLGAAGVSFGAPALLAGCGGGGGSGGDDIPPPRDLRESRTLFFNFAHLGKQPTTQHLCAAGRKYTLTRVVDQPQVLRDARVNNEFLRGVPDDQITHHVEAAEFSLVAPTLVYVSCNETPASGRWEMSSMFLYIPTPSMAHAYAHASNRSGGSTLPMSSKRRRYGARAADSVQDLQDERVLIDCTDHAAALVGVHPELLSLEPNSAAAIHVSYINVDSNTEFLALELQTMGPAAPAGSANVSGNPSWATLVPLMDTTANPPVPFKKFDGQLDQFYPDWAPQVSDDAAQGTVSVQPLVRDDPTLGADVTGYTPANPLPAAQALGKVWSRHDGIATVARSANATQADAPSWTFSSKSSSEGLVVYDPTDISISGDGRVQVKVAVVSNWYLRWLGMYIQFVDPNGVKIPTANLPSGTLPDQSGQPGGLDTEDVKFVGVLGPPTAFLGVPVYPGKFAPVVLIPKDAATMRIFYSGASTSRSYPGNPAEDITAIGTGMTVAVNYGLVGLFMAMGDATIDPSMKEIVSLGAGFVAAELSAIIGPVILDGGSTTLGATAMAALKIMFQRALSKTLTALAEFIAKQLVVAEFIDSIPVAGQIARSVAGVVGALTMLETSFEIAMSPPVYQYDLVLTHSLAVTVLPDAGNNQFPQVPSGYTLYYKVSYLFDRGTAHVLDAVDVADPAVPSIAISLDGIPRGGQVNVMIGFYARTIGAKDGQNDWCAGHGSTGLIDNTLDQAPTPITITQTKVPIQASTVYIHTRKTVLDASGNHRWSTTATAPPYVMPPDGQVPGLGGFRGITVRQATSQPAQAGYVGYAWKAYSSGLFDCNAHATGQLDQLANLNSDASDGGVHAQDGYAVINCGLQAGARIAYNLLDHQARNFYLESDQLHVRQVQLGNPPGFAPPHGGQSFGRLNMDSTQLLLHPAGHVVSINNAYHKLETLRLPDAAVSDAEATKSLMAQTHSGFGSRPGLMKSPVAAAITPDGAILVLEGSQLNNRIQAFDLGGNAVPLFKQQPQPHFLSLPVTAGMQYLDLAVEFTGYLYVLSKDVSGNHRLDIYHPGQTGTQPICTTHGVNAARLAVDLWRSVYTLNYEMLLLPGNGVPQISEPSVSLWVPPPPPPT